MADIVIRPVTLDDIPSITRIYQWYVLNSVATFEETVPSTEEMTQRFSIIKSGNFPYLCAEQNGEILGYCYFAAFRARSAFRFTVENSIYLDQTRRQQGLGSLLLDALLEEGKKGPWQEMIAVIGDSANIASIRLHQKKGFEMCGTLKNTGFKFNRWIDTVFLQKNLK